jgi:hypothetical protein
MSSGKRVMPDEESVSDAQKTARATTSVIKNEPALELIQKPFLTSASNFDAREGLTVNRMHRFSNSCKYNSPKYLKNLKK